LLHYLCNCVSVFVCGDKIFALAYLMLPSKWTALNVIACSRVGDGCIESSMVPTAFLWGVVYKRGDFTSENFLHKPPAYLTHMCDSFQGVDILHDERWTFISLMRLRYNYDVCILKRLLLPTCYIFCHKTQVTVGILPVYTTRTVFIFWKIYFVVHSFVVIR